MRGALALPAIALALVAAKDDPLAGRVAGKPLRCVDLSRVSGPQITEDGAIIYRRTERTLYVSRPVDHCPSLRPLDTLVVEIYGGQTCAGDRFRTITPPLSIPSAYCRFGPFVPYEKR